MQYLQNGINCQEHLRSARNPAHLRHVACAGLRGSLDKVYLYAIQSRMIKGFRHKGLERFFKTGSKAGIQPQHAPRLRLQLARLDSASSPADMSLPGWKLHPLSGGLKTHWAVRVSGNWRLTFIFEGEDALLVDYRDYH